MDPGGHTAHCSCPGNGWYVPGLQGWPCAVAGIGHAKPISQGRQAATDVRPVV